MHNHSSPQASILVTGGAGFIGSALIRYLHANTSCRILNIDKLSYAGSLQSLQALETSGRYSFRQLDLTEGAALDAALDAFRPDAIFHLAAESHVDRSIDGPDAFIEANIGGTYQLLQSARAYFERLDAAARASFRLVHISTDEVFGSLEPGEAPFTETSPYQPRSPYAATKAASDHLVRAWQHTYGLPTLVTNCSNNYGPYQFPEKLIPVVILKCLRGEPIPIYGEGANVRDWLYVDDHAAALWAALRQGRVGQTYAIGGDNEVSNLELAQMICATLDELAPSADGCAHATKITFVTDRPGHDARYAINAAKARGELRWEPRVSFASGLRTTVQWYLDHPDWWRDLLQADDPLKRRGSGTAPDGSNDTK